MAKNEILVEIGKRIRKIRKSKKIAQDKFALEANIDRSYYGCIERGENNISALNLIKIALTLGVEVGKLFPKIKDIKINPKMIKAKISKNNN